MSFLPDPRPVDVVNWDSIAIPYWTSMTPYMNATNWQTFDTTNNRFEVCKDALGFVHFRGLVKSVAAYAFATSSTLTIATLPVFLRPAVNHDGLFVQQDSTTAKALIRFTITNLGFMVIVNEAYNAATNNGSVIYGKLLIDPFYAPRQSA